ncbi:TonB-dependent receptor [Marinobacter sp. HL-58]|uniref:TonB-dependent receptor domain-containing protein n=1 Tax=Marinobacter sp. HL-58 TaxID=1479237 RepID=UPI000485E52B|nr:TonB-dependent receptor [Marinobacter sp. HL-58]KPP96989.1 MAG: TonB-dependent cobalamin receptor BtuB [Marinobacter sp. HL-58]
MGFSKSVPALVMSGFPLILLSPSTASADDTEAAPELDPIVVTATIGPRTAGESLSSVTVIEEDAIRREAPAEFKDLMRGQPGIDVVTNGSYGKNTSVFTRGTTNDSSVFLVDGVRLRSATSGGAPWQYFPSELVERVEIVRGPRSALYGADAVGGVIQAFTLDPKRGNKGWVEAGTGNFNTQKTSAGASATSGATRFSLSGLHKETDGTRIAEDGDDKGFRNTAGIGRIVHELPSGGEASAVMMQSEGNTEFDGGNTDFMIRTVGFNLDTPISDYWDSSVQLSEAADEQDNFRTAGDSVFNTKTRTARWENTFTGGVHELAVGGELQSDEVESSTEFEEDSRTNAALFGQLRLNFGPSDVQLSLRGDDNEAYGRQETGGVALGHSFNRSHRMRVSYGTSFRAPTFNDLYYPLETFSFGGTYAGNPDLEPEEGSSVEIGFSGRYQAWYWDAAIYQLDVDDLIDIQTVGVDSRPVNVNEARIRGIEVGSGFRANDWDLAVKLSLLDPRDRETDNRLRRRSHQSLRVDLDRQLGAWSVGGTVQASGYRYDDADNEDRLPGYATLNLRAGWEFARDWNARLTLQNVTDKEYATAQQFDGTEYLAAGTAGFLSVRYDFR